MSKSGSQAKTEPTRSIYAMEGKCLGVRCYRGYAPLSVLSLMSMADEYHQTRNPTGTQRDLNTKHAKAAYNYARDNCSKRNALWPEIILNIRDDGPLRIKQQASAKGPRDGETRFVKITIDWEKLTALKRESKIAISRVDGNHRLYFVGGDRNRAYPALDVYSPFCITVGLTTEDEKVIFRTINFEQRRLNVAHLLRIEQQTTADTEMWRKDKALWLAGKLSEDQTSPFCGRVHKAGKKEKGESYLIRQKSLLDGLRQLLHNFPSHESIKDPQVMLKAVINYFNAVQQTWPDEWLDHKKFKLMTNTGLQALGTVGGKLMGMLVNTGTLAQTGFAEKLAIVNREHANFWDSKGQFMDGMAGRPGGQKIAEEMMDAITDVTSLVIKT